MWSVLGSNRISNSSKLLCMSSLPVSMKRIPSITTEKKWQHRFSNYTPSVAMETSGRIWPNFELIQAFIHVPIACKYMYEKDQMENSGENVMTSFSPLYVDGIFFRRSRAANSVVHGRISPNFELIQALMYIIVTCKYEKDPIKNVSENVMTPFFPTVTLSVAMGTSSRIWPNFEAIQAFMHVLIACRFEKDPIKNSGENVMTSFSPLSVYGICFSYALGHLTP